MNPLTESLLNKSLQNKDEQHFYQPIFFRLNDQSQQKELQNLLNQKPNIRVYDTIKSQLKELVKTSRPNKTLKMDEIETLIQSHLNGTDINEYGVWVYYPWSDKLVHIVDEEEFTLLRTNRNMYKITNPERITLSKKKIGVIGLSVGQSVSLTLAMERSFGELRIADYDDLEITNLNRLRSGIHNMGLLKTVLVAREIAEIDPFLKVTCFHEGITENNIESFLTDNGKLDVLIDECDSIDIKIMCRLVAKKHQIPVLMEASDRATIDVERFDLDPNRSILHGYIDHLDLTKIKDLKTSEEKLPYMLPIAGVETLSTRMKASALEVGQSISTWPQLASAVALGGGVTADICRRILLDQFHQSGRYFVDVEEIIGDPPKNYKVEDKAKAIDPLNIDAIKAILQAANIPAVQGTVVPSKDVIHQLMEAASLAPSAGNNQPWKWYFDNESLWLFHDLHRSVSFGDFQSMASLMSLGAGIENVSIKAQELGVGIDVKLFPGALGKNPIARISFTNKAAGQDFKYLAQYIRSRHTNRNTLIPGNISDEVFKEMNNVIVNNEHVRFMTITKKEDIAEMADIVGTAERLRVFISEGHFDLFEKEFRWNPEQAIKSRDGLDLETFEISLAEHFGLRLARDPKVVDYLYQWDAGKGLEKISRSAVLSSSGIGVIIIPEFNPENLVEAGRAVEKIWLVADKHKLSIQPMLAPLLHFNRILFSENSQMNKDLEERFIELYNKFYKILNVSSKDNVSVFLFRIGFASKEAVKSLRLPVEEIFFQQ